MVATGLASVAPATAETTLAIGVISPETGRSAATGVQHRKSIEWALHDVGYSVASGGRHVTLHAIFADDHGDPAEAVRLATKLANEDQVVAILGPANSACTSEVLKAGLGVPVISPLSSAPSLTTQRDPYFFRATIDDRERMHRFVEFLQQERRLGDTAVLLYEDDAYGQGLSASLTETLPGGSVQSKAWDDAVKDPAAMVAALPAGKVSLFLLGTESVALHLAGQLHGLLIDAGKAEEVQFLFVGNGERLQQEAPDDSITIGEPVPDVQTASLLDAPGMVDPFVAKDRQFLLTAYEAARFVLPRALQYALAGGVDPSDVRTIRERLKTALETRSFDSLAPTRKIRFAGGNLVDPPRTPIYQVDRKLTVLDPLPPSPWLSVVVPDTTRFLEEPVQVTLERHGPGPRQAVKLEILDDDDEIVESDSVDLGEGGKAVYTFHPRKPGHFRIWSSDVMVPNEPAVQVQYPVDYGIALLGALLGLMLATQSLSVPLKRTWQAMAAGAVLFGLTSYGRAIPGLGSLPLPSLSPSRPVNAFFSGIVGGWGGFDGLLVILQMIPWWPKAGRPDEPAHVPPSEAGAAVGRG